jgi:hypothetical protein
LKKYLLTILIIISFCTKAHASVEGRMFLEIQDDMTVSLEKVFEKNIKSKNVRNAFLYTTNKCVDISENLKKSLEEKKEFLELDVIFNFCLENCKSNEHPYVKIHYSFNNPPEILLHLPEDDFLTEHNEILFEWEGKDKDGKFLEYSLEIFNEDFLEKTPWSSKNDHEINLETGNYFWKVHTRDNSFLENVVSSETRSFEIEEEEEETPEVLVEDIEIVVDVVPVEIEDSKPEETEIPVREPDPDILGIGSSAEGAKPSAIQNPSLCLYKYNSTHKRFEGRKCKINAPKILKVENVTGDSKSHTVNITGVYNPDMLILIDEYRCTLPIVCRGRFVKRTRILATPYTAIATYMNEKFSSMNAFRRINKYFFTSHLLEKTNPLGKRVNLRYHINHGFKYGDHWVDMNFNSPYSNTRAVPPATRISNNSSNRIYRFPFSRNIGVTQWHGYTAFQSPHTGVDFGSYKEPVYAIGDGIIREAKWDNYSGTCLSGGFFVRIEHNNGMNSVYLHLENFKKSSGQNWRVGERIRRNDLIGITGNTGAFNCQPLGYHLHFELRKNNLQRNHVNPVPYINVNWDNIHTIQHTKYPGRLTGNNPHPTW